MNRSPTDFASRLNCPLTKSCHVRRKIRGPQRTTKMQDEPSFVFAHCSSWCTGGSFSPSRNNSVDRRRPEISKRKRRQGANDNKRRATNSQEEKELSRAIICKSCSGGSRGSGPSVCYRGESPVCIGHRNSGLRAGILPANGVTIEEGRRIRSRRNKHEI